MEHNSYPDLDLLANNSSFVMPQFSFDNLVVVVVYLFTSISLSLFYNALILNLDLQDILVQITFAKPFNQNLIK